MPIDSLSPTPPASRVPPIALAVIIALVGVWHATTIRSGHDWGDDFAMYIQHAKNIATGVDYRTSRFIYNAAYPTQPPAYPPLLPLLLAPVYRLAGLNLDAMKRALIPIFLASLAAFAALWRDRLTPWSLVAAVAVIGFNPYLWSVKDNILSDVPFLLFTLLALLAANQAGRQSRPRIRDGLAVAAGVCLACWTRNAGSVLIPTVIGYDLIRWRRLTWLSGCTILAFSALFLVQSLTLGALGGALLFDPRPAVILDNARRYGVAFGTPWWNGVSLPLSVALMAVILGLAAGGYALAWRRVSAAEIFVPLYAMLILTWNSFQGARFLIPLIPFVVGYTFMGIDGLQRLGRPRLRHGVLAALLIAVALSYAGRYTHLDFGPLQRGIGAPTSVALFGFLHNATPDDAVIAFIKPRAASLFTERRSIAFHAMPDDSEFLAFLGRAGVTYLVIGPEDVAPQNQADARRTVEQHAACFELVYQNTDFSVYRVQAQRPGCQTE